MNQIADNIIKSSQILNFKKIHGSVGLRRFKIELMFPREKLASMGNTFFTEDQIDENIQRRLESDVLEGKNNARG